VEARTATINRIRGLLSEFGIVLPQKAEVVRREAGRHLDDLPGWANTAIGDSLSELHHLDERIAEYDLHIKVMAQADDRGRKLMTMPGVGATTASALLASSKNKTDRLSRWAQGVAERRGYWKAVVAVAAKNARMAWAMLSKGEAFKPLA
jgi:transposase